MQFPLCLTTLPLTASLCICSWLPVCAQNDALHPLPSPRVGAQPSEPAPAAASSFASIPGPLRSFMRMAAISQKVSSEEVLPLLARNVFTEGYEG